MREEVLHYLYRTKSLGKDFVTTKGEKLSILDFGESNPNAGPDFLQCKIQFDGLIWSGPIEFHVNASDWYKHRHQGDPAYDNVIAHFVYHADVEVSSGGHLLPTVELKNLFSAQSLAQLGNFVRNKSFVPCAEQIKSINREVIEALISSLSLNRLEERSSQIDLGGDELQWLLSRRMAYCFGGKVNGHSMMRLLELARPFITQNGLEGLLFSLSGLGEQENKHLLHPMSKTEWKFSRMRPPSFPTNRIKQLAAYLQHPITVDDLRNKPSVGDLRSFLPGGRAFQDHLIINGLALFTYALGKHENDVRLQAHAIDLLRAIDPERNRIISDWKSCGIEVRNAMETQGLIQLKNEMCDLSKCLDCAVGKSLIYGT